MTDEAPNEQDVKRGRVLPFKQRAAAALTQRGHTLSPPSPVFLTEWLRNMVDARTMNLDGIEALLQVAEQLAEHVDWVASVTVTMQEGAKETEFNDIRDFIDLMRGKLTSARQTLDVEKESLAIWTGDKKGTADDILRLCDRLIE